EIDRGQPRAVSPDEVCRRGLARASCRPPAARTPSIPRSAGSNIFRSRKKVADKAWRYFARSKSRTELRPGSTTRPALLQLCRALPSSARGPTNLAIISADDSHKRTDGFGYSDRSGL